MLFTKGLALACLSSSATGFTSPSFASLNQNNRQAILLPIPSTTTATFSTVSDVYYDAFDIAEDSPRGMTFVLDIWAADHGIQKSNGFKLQEEDNGREIYAVTNEDAPAGTPILIVPENLILSSNKAIAELRGYGIEEAEDDLINMGSDSEFRQYYLMLKILQEIQLGKDSAWFFWLDSMPRYFTNSVSMTDFCLLCLPPLMKKLANDERENQQRLDLCGDLKYHPRDLVKWAYQIVYTRSIETEDGDLQIVPMGDYFNHGSEFTEIESEYDDAGNYCAYTSYDVPAGSLLWISYADPRNPSHLLARYGFLDETCPATYCKLLPPTVNQDMLDLGYAHDRMLFYQSGEVADEVSCYLCPDAGTNAVLYQTFN